MKYSVRRFSELKQKDFVSASYKNHKQKKEADKKKAEIKLNEARKRSSKAEKEIEKIKPVLNDKAEFRLIKQANTEVNADVYEDRYKVTGINGKGRDGIIDDSRIPRILIGSKKRSLKGGELPKEILDIEKSLDSGKKVIKHTKEAGVESLAHEIGHLQFDKKGGRKTGRTELEESKLNLKEERAASVNAIGNMRNAGVSKKDIKQGKSNLRKREKTYQYAKDRIRYTNKIDKDSNNGDNLLW